MSVIYSTKEGDILDYICWKYYQKTSGVVEKVLEANRHLANLGDTFAAGVKITLPDLEEEQEEADTVRLWS